MVGLVEEELNREGLTMGVLAHPPKLHDVRDDAGTSAPRRPHRHSLARVARGARRERKNSLAACGHGRALPGDRRRP